MATMLLVSSSGLLQQDASATILRHRANKALDKHIDASGAHGEAVQRYKDTINDSGGGPCPDC